MYLIIICVLILILYLARGRIHILKQRWFANFMSNIAATVAEALKPFKLRLFSTLINKKGNLRILEIGCGSGANLQYFPKGSLLTTVDINPSFYDNLKKNLDKYPDIKLEKHIICSAEDMSELQNDSFDIVVSTTVLCSVPNVPQALSEVFRVLAPGGKFYCIEHVLDKRDNMRAFVQNVLSWVWPHIFCGCTLNKDIKAQIKNTGFTDTDIDDIYIQNDLPVIRYVIKSQILCVATK